MQIVRTLVWIALTVILMAFIAMNLQKVPVNFWPLADGRYVHFEWPVGFTALVFFLLGFAPMWLLLRANRWRLNRRIAALENSLRAAAAVAPEYRIEPDPDPEPEPEPAPGGTGTQEKNDL